jgi:hypothetical protein
MLTVSSTGDFMGNPGMTKATLMTLGTPGLHAVRRLLLQAMLKPQDSRPGRPLELFVAHMWALHSLVLFCSAAFFVGFFVTAFFFSRKSFTTESQDPYPIVCELFVAF